MTFCKPGYGVVNAGKLGSTPHYMNFCSSKVGEKYNGKTVKSVYICKIGKPIPQNACADGIEPEAGAPLESDDLAYNYSCTKDTPFTKVFCGFGFEPWEYWSKEQYMHEVGAGCRGWR